MIRRPNQDETGRKLLAAKLLAADRMRLLLRQPFIGSFIMRLELTPVWDSRLQDACNDGRTVFLNTYDYLWMTESERLALLAHEVWHIALMHAFRRKGRNIKLWWIAADLEAFFALAKDGLKPANMPDYHPSWDGLSAEEIYERAGQPMPPKRISNQGMPRPAPVSTPSAADADGTGDGKDQNVLQNVTHGAIPACHLEPQSPLPLLKDTAALELVEDPDFVPEFGTYRQEQIRWRVLDALLKIQRKQGRLPGHLEKLFDLHSKTQLDWRELLAQFVTSCQHGDRRWLPPSRRYLHQRLYLPSRRSERVHGVVAVDSSGSMLDELPAVLGEVAALLRTFGKFNLTVIQSDAEIQSVEEYDENRPVGSRNMEVKGLGGTSFKPVFDYVSKHGLAADFLVYLTDGQGDACEYPPPYPVLWIVTPAGRVPTEWGTHVKLNRYKEGYSND